MYSNQIEKVAREKLKIKGFLGVYSLDKLPVHLPSPPYRFIVNTHTSNLPGEHWLAVSGEKTGKIYVFDPMGFFYPPLLVQYLAKLRKPLIFNKTAYQSPSSRECGQYCLSWLQLRNKYE